MRCCIPNQLALDLGVYGEDYFPSPALAIIEIDYKSSLALPDKLKRALEFWNSDSIECFAIVHDAPRFAPCQKFTCDGVDEFNLMYHAWAFPDHDYDPERVSSEKLEGGCFDPIGVQGVHLNLVDGGMAINEVKSDYTIVIHDMAFSPANAMLRADFSESVASFFTVAHLPSSSTRRTVITYHIVPLTDHASQGALSATQKAQNLNELVSLLEAVEGNNKGGSQRLKNLLLSALP